MPTDIHILESIPLFSELEHDELEQIAEMFHHVKITEGEVFMKRGDSAHTFFIVLSGNYLVHFKDDRAFTLHEKGNIMGWSTVVPPYRYRGTGIGLTEGELLYMPGEEFKRLIQGNSALGDKLMKKINRVVEERIPFFAGDEALKIQEEEPEYE